MAGKTVERTEKLDSLALDLYKHFQFAPRLINEKVVHDDFKPNTIYTYFMGMKNYIKHGTPNLKQAPQAFYDAIQECVDKHVAQLTPKESEKVRVINRTYKMGPRKQKPAVKVYHTETTKPSTVSKNKINISKETMETIQNIGKVSGVGIKVGSNIKLFENEDVLTGYVQCLNDLKPQLTEEVKWEVIDFTYKVKS